MKQVYGTSFLESSEPLNRGIRNLGSALCVEIPEVANKRGRRTSLKFVLCKLVWQFEFALRQQQLASLWLLARRSYGRARGLFEEWAQVCSNNSNNNNREYKQRGRRLRAQANFMQTIQGLESVQLDPHRKWAVAWSRATVRSSVSMDLTCKLPRNAFERLTVGLNDKSTCVCLKNYPASGFVSAYKS